MVRTLSDTQDAITNMSHFDDEKFKQLELNVKFNVIPKTRLKEFIQQFNGYTTGLVRSDPGNFVMTPLYGKHAERLYRMQPRSDDIWLLTFPKCGKYKFSHNKLVRVIWHLNFYQEQLGLLNCCGYWWTTATRRKQLQLLWLPVLPLQSI